jgi:hypothetical protein
VPHSSCCASISDEATERRSVGRSSSTCFPIFRAKGADRVPPRAAKKHDEIAPLHSITSSAKTRGRELHLFYQIEHRQGVQRITRARR